MVFLRNSLNKVLFVVGCGLLLFTAGCGNGNGGLIQSGGTFSAASLNGRYTFQVSGIDLVGFFQEAGTFVADGNQNITSGSDDLMRGGALSTSSISGTYQVFSDGTGFINLNSSGRALQLAITMVTPSKVYLVVSAEALASVVSANGYGLALKQDSSAFTAPPSGTFAFRVHTKNPNQGEVSARVGAMTITGGGATGAEDVNLSGTVSQQDITGGTFGFPDADGRGGAFLIDDTGTTNYLYYVVDAGHFFLLSTDSGILGAGQADVQSGGPFSPASLSGSYAFGARGDTGANFNGADVVGRFTADGLGGITAGAFDSSEDGNPSNNVAFTGAVNSLSGPGRAAISLSETMGGGSGLILWMVSPSRAFFLISSASVVEDGTMDLQQLSSFADSSMHGQFALVMDGFDGSGFALDRVGTLNWDGNGGLTLNEFVNSGGITNAPGLLGGSYQTNPNGRITGTLSGISNAVVFYAITPTDAYYLLNDPGVVISGTMSKQVQP